MTGNPRSPSAMPSLAEASRLWLRIGCLSFGGPAGQIALLHRMVVDERRWISEDRFLQALNFCTLLPGPEAQQLATYLGWLMNGVAGGFAAGFLFIIPGALVMLGLSALYAILGAVPMVGALFLGLKSAVLALVAEAVLRIGGRALKGRWAWVLATASFAALFFLSVPFPVVMLASGLVGAWAPGHFVHTGNGKAGNGTLALIDIALDADPARVARSAQSARRAGFLCAVGWVLPLVFLRGTGVFADVAWFFSTMAVVTFGGAYAVLAYAAQEAVGTYHWVSPPEMLTGLGLAETTPGPLILVLQFVGFLAGFRAPGPLTGLWGGVAASFLTLWVTFAPCFTWVFLGAPLIETLRRNTTLSGALAAITASVVGVIANLALWFALHSLFIATIQIRALGLSFDAPLPSSVDLKALLLAVLAAVVLFRFKLGVVATLAISATASIILHLI